MSLIHNREWREWLGLTWADLCVYLALGCLVALFIVEDSHADTLLSFAAVGLALWSCRLGMPSDPEYSELTNLFKVLAYPAVLVLVLLVIGVHALLIWKGYADYAGQGVAHTLESLRTFIQDLP